MAAEIITKEDLQEFGEQLLNQMKALIGRGQVEEPIYAGWQKITVYNPPLVRTGTKCIVV